MQRKTDFTTIANAAFTCYRNYHKYEFPNWPYKAVHVQFPTRKLAFTIIPIARERSISLL